MVIKEVISRKSGLKGTITIPADKSISHRAILFSSLAKGKSVVKNFSKGADCMSSLSVCKKLGVDAQFIDNSTLLVLSSGLLKAPETDLYCGNSGTTMRLMSGILAGQKFDSVLTGDESLSKRPMKRVINPIELMGGSIESNEMKAPLKIKGSSLHSIQYISPIASAQVKSCVLLAGLNAEGVTSVTEPYVSRNHTELMLQSMDANLIVEGTKVTISKSELKPLDMYVAGDISSAAFFIVAASIIEGSEIIIKNVGLNETRTGIIDVIKTMGGDIEILDLRVSGGEQVGDIRVKYSELKACEISGEIIPRLIDELPIIAVLATQAEGQTVIKDAGDLRNKESDRIKAVVDELRKIGANIEETLDGFIINGKTSLKGGCEVETYHDHRLAMSWYVAGLISQNPILINGFEWVNVSFPEFEQTIMQLY